MTCCRSLSHCVLSPPCSILMFQWCFFHMYYLLVFSCLLTSFFLRSILLSLFPSSCVLLSFHDLILSLFSSTVILFPLSCNLLSFFLCSIRCSILLSFFPFFYCHSFFFYSVVILFAISFFPPSCIFFIFNDPQTGQC